MPDKRREGSLEAPTRHALDWQSEEFYSEERCVMLGRLIGIDHENYQVEVRNVADNIRESLLNDLD